MYTEKFIGNGSALEHAGKEIYFCDVYLFTEPAKDIAVVKGAFSVRENLWMSLQGKASEWWTAELSATKKWITKLGDSVNKWSTLLASRFKESAIIAIDAFLQEQYIVLDAILHCETWEYA